MTPLQIVGLCVTILVGIASIIFGVLGQIKAKKATEASKKDCDLKEAEWRGGINAKLDVINNGVNGVNVEIRCIKDTLSGHAILIQKALDSTASAHHRIDEICKK